MTINFSVQIIKIQTTADGAIRLTLDMPETAIDIMAQLAECKSRGGLLEIAALPIEAEKEKQWRDQQD